MKELLTFLREQADKIVSATVVAVIAWGSQREIRKANVQKTAAESKLTESQTGKTEAEKTDIVIQAADKVIGRYEERDRALVGRIEEMEKEMRAVVTHVTHLEQVIRDAGLQVPARPEHWPWSL